ncbi:MAG: hypothetical protein LBV51_02405 [Acholeplasmatales bacterium]|jgi:hypothetical protein|nr:hypothetical protein [Acholeplasmatales bacterium]
MEKQFIYTTLTKKALELSYAAHGMQVDKSSTPYVFHPFYLACQMGDDENAICVALLHDVFEDSNDKKIIQTIRDTFPKEVIDALDILNHNKNDDYIKKYIPRIKSNELARKVKLSDLRHNSNIDRLETITWEDVIRLAKYKRAIMILENSMDLDYYNPLIESMMSAVPNYDHVICVYIVNNEKWCTVDPRFGESKITRLHDEMAANHYKELLSNVTDCSIDFNDGQITKTGLTKYKLFYEIEIGE